MDQLFYAYLLLHVIGVGPKTIDSVMMDENWTADFSYIEPLILPSYKERAEQSWAEVMAHEKEWKLRYEMEQFVALTQSTYPKWLKEIYAPPPFLFYKGDISLLQEPALAIIGSRKPCSYSYDVLEALIPILAKHYVIVSGLAKGIDTRSHQRTIFYKGHTIGVLGNSLDYYYPKENYALQQKMGHEQLVITEYPLGTRPHPHHFPARNRIISGLTQGTVVIQAAKKSGTMITASQALEAGREVFAVPGCLNDPQFEGCLDLIHSGATLVRNADDIMEALRFWTSMP